MNTHTHLNVHTNSHRSANTVDCTTQVITQQSIRSTQRQHVLSVHVAGSSSHFQSCESVPL